MTSYFQIMKHETGITEVILSRPKLMNSMDGNFFTQIKSIFQEIDKDTTTNVVLISASGNHFTSGLDLKFATVFMKDYGSNTENAKAVYNTVLEWQACFSSIAKCKKPVICAIQGWCIGGGVDLATACDVRVCTKNAKFSVRETKLAIVADLGTLQRLGRIVGKGFANEMALTGDDYDASRALSSGLVNRVYENVEDMMDAARKMALSIASNSPLVVQATKHILEYSEDHTIEDGCRYVALWNSAFLKSDDLKEAIMSFIQKKKPIFKNRL